MKNDRISKLKRENDRLQYLADHDELTGILNRRAAEAQIRKRIPAGGFLLVCDLDGFKQINDRFGHMLGDRYLCDTARLLSFFLRGQDLLGRIGGDEFVIFSPGSASEQRMNALIAAIGNRFASYAKDEAVPIGISVGGAVSCPGDTYETLFDRADQELLHIKDLRRGGKAPSSGRSDGWVQDIRSIRRELTEEISRSGAQCRDFQAFKTICHFIERCIGRDGRQAAVILMSLVDAGDAPRVPFDIRQQMQLLGDILQRTLRMGDVYTRYSSCQYLILLVNVDLERAELVEARIEKLFRASSNEHLIFHCCFALEEAKLPE